MQTEVTYKIKAQPFTVIRSLITGKIMVCYRILSNPEPYNHSDKSHKPAAQLILDGSAAGLTFAASGLQGKGVLVARAQCPSTPP